jgi:signal peptidase I, bacterial type
MTEGEVCRTGGWFGSHPEAILRRLVVVLALVLIMRGWVWSPLLITGASMLPTLRGGQFAGVNKLIYRFREPRRGEIVAVWTGKELWVKRIVGLPGETIAVRKGILFINGKPLQETYVAFNDCSDIEPGKIKANHFVVAGDNRRPMWVLVVSRDRIVGRMTLLRTSDARLNISVISGIISGNKRYKPKSTHKQNDRKNYDPQIR